MNKWQLAIEKNNLFIISPSQGTKFLMIEKSLTMFPGVLKNTFENYFSIITWPDGVVKSYLYVMGSRLSRGFMKNLKHLPKGL